MCDVPLRTGEFVDTEPGARTVGLALCMSMVSNRFLPMLDFERKRQPWMGKAAHVRPTEFD